MRPARCHEGGQDVRAAVYEQFGGPIDVRKVPDPVPESGEVVVEVLAVGLCRSDVHGWRGTDPDIVCPHVGGHEFVGRVVEVAAGVSQLAVGDRVVAPFVCGCGTCEACRAGHPQVCRNQQQPGFTMWGGFAQYCRIPYAANNAVLVPEAIDDISAALVGCRVSTAYRGVVERGRIASGEVLAVHGCGGVGLAAVAIGHAVGAYVMAIDVEPAALVLAQQLGADVTLDASAGDVGDHIQALGGAHVSVDCLGSAAVASASIRSLRPLGRHVQIGLFPSATAELPISRVVRDELELLGVHGQSAARFGPLFDLLLSGRLDLAPLVTARISLDDVPEALPAMASFARSGVSVVTRFAAG
jgi:alcohol dehydrogenase